MTPTDRMRVSLVRCRTYEPSEVEGAVRQAVDLLGGISAFVRPGARVLVKPNMLTDAAPDTGIDTHPEVVRAVLRLVKSVTPHVVCGDAPSVFGEKRDVDRVYEISGIRRVCVEEGVEMVYFNSPRLRGPFPLTDQLDTCDCAVSVSKLKTHGLTVLTAGVKNCFGFVVGMNKLKIHRDFPHPADLCRTLVDIYELCRPHLSICDAVTAMQGEGPGSSGQLRTLGLVAASTDALALDVVLAQVMGLEPEDVPTNREGLRRAAAAGRPLDVALCGEPLDTFVAKDFLLPRTTFLHRIPRGLLSMARVLLRMRLDIDARHCQVCGLCAKSCPGHAIENRNGRMAIDPRRCILCLCCQEICPHGAVSIKKGLFLRLLEKA